MGVIFLVAVIPKMRGDPWVDRMVGFLQAVALENAHGFYRGFVESVVLVHPALFANLVLVGELLVGLALLTGTVTRLAAGVAMFMTLNYMFGTGAWFWTPSSNNAAFFFIALILILGSAGRAFGVDYFLAQKWPKAGIW